MSPRGRSVIVVMPRAAAPDRGRLPPRLRFDVARQEQETWREVAKDWNVGDGPVLAVGLVGQSLC